MREVVIVSGTRTPIGRFGGTLKDVSDMDVGALVIREALKRAGISGEQVDEVIFASGYRTGDLPINSARVVAVKGGGAHRKTPVYHYQGLRREPQGCFFSSPDDQIR